MRAVTTVASVYVVAACLVSLLGWVLNAPRLSDWTGSGIAIKANAAIALLAAGLALLLYSLSSRLKFLTFILAATAAAIGGSTLFQYIAGVDFGIDTLLFSEPPGVRATASPGRMGMPAATSILLIGIGEILLCLGGRFRKWVSYAGSATLAIASLSLIGYLYGADQLYSIPKYTGIALQTATIIAALAFGLAIIIPEYGVVAAITRQDAGGLVFRQLIVPAILVSLLLGWLRLSGQTMGLFDVHFGTAIRTMAEILLLLGLLWVTTNSISRFESQTRLISLMPKENPHPMMRISSAGSVLYANPVAEAMNVDWADSSRDMIARQFRDGANEAFRENTKREHQIEIGEETYSCTFVPISESGYVNVYCSDVTARLRSENLLARRADQLMILNELANGLSRSISAEEIYESALDAITAGLHCDRASILLFDDDKVMSFVAWRGLSDDYRAAVNGHSPWPYGATDCRPIGVTDIRTSDESQEIKSIVTAEGISALGFVPLVSNGTLIGKFMVYYNEPHEFTDQELGLAATIAHQVAFSVERRRTEQRRREVEIALTENDARFRLATRTGKVGVWDWDVLTGRITWSESLYVMHGIDENGFDGTIAGFASFVHPDDGQRVQSLVDEALAGNARYELEFRAVKPDGQVVWLSTNATVLRDGDTPIRMIGATVDITDRKLAEIERAKLAKIVESSNDAIISKDVNSIITSWNRAATAMFGYSPEEVIGQPITVLFPEDRMNEEEGIISRIRRGENVDHYETIRKRKDGTLINISLTISPIYDESGRIIGASKIARDITERKAAETAVRESEIMHTLVEAQEAERHRIARDLHDHLGQQLTALRLKLESIRSGAENAPALLKVIDETREQAERIDMDVNFLSWELRPTELELLGLPDALSSFIREWSTNYGIAADFHVGSAARTRLSREVETHLYRIVQEGLNNILKHAKASKVDVLLEHREGDAILIIEDDGVGFDPDLTISKNGKKGAGGLGLVGMRERAAILGGTLEIETKPNEGTTVFARIPLHQNGNGLFSRDT